MVSTEKSTTTPRCRHFFLDDEEEDWVKPKSLWDDEDDQEVVLEE